MNPPKYKMTPEEIANQLAKLENPELGELANHIDTMHPLDRERITEMFEKKLGYEKAEKIGSLESELDQLEGEIEDLEARVKELEKELES